MVQTLLYYDCQIPTSYINRTLLNCIHCNLTFLQNAKRIGYDLIFKLFLLVSFVFARKMSLKTQ